jgi:antitoxin (DNA-binding transcriptional repressor) of toxin-antitoxin stability system
MARTAPKLPVIPPALVARVARGERVLVKKGGKTVAALVPLAGARALRDLEDYLDGVEAMRRLSDPREKPISWEKVKRDLRLS